ncbi:MAG: hypothetical protein IH598_12910 [Bacteroidales bacterium]|nr:hypothetical protein [Bacteroidales bacterium]
MKPTKNRVFCKDSRRSKMLFETEKKADTFIKFNSETIEQESGYKPERSYFCVYCGGWHVTSHKECSTTLSRTEKVLNEYKQEIEKKAKLLETKAILRSEKQEKLKKSLETLEKSISMMEFSKLDLKCTIELLTKANEELRNIKSIGATFKGSSKRKKDAQEKLNILNERIKIIEIKTIH